MPAVNITGVPVYDGMIEGGLYFPSKLSEILNQYDPHDIGFWIGVFLFFVVIIWIFTLFSGGD
jgi:hypothetical protein